MSKTSRKSSNDLLKTVGGVALILILFVVILRAALAPLYQEVAQIEARQDLQPNVNGGGGDFGGDDQSEENTSGGSLDSSIGGSAGLGAVRAGIQAQTTAGGAPMFGMVGEIGGPATTGMAATTGSGTAM
jgi:hypothetical protein